MSSSLSEVTRRWALALALVVACGEPAPPPRTPAPPAVPTIHVTHVNGDRFRVDYTFPTPAKSLTFVLPSPVVRAKWRAASEEMRLVRADGVDTLIAPEARTTWAIELDVDELHPEKDYRTFYRLTDRGLLLYTGHLAAVPTDAPPKDPMRLVLTAAPDERVLVHAPSGNMQGPEVTAIALPGTYAYFGTLKPVETADFIGVVDRGFPPALRARLDELVPALFERYGDAFGRPPQATEKPLLFASFHSLTYDGRDMGGGVMPPRVINLDFGLGPTPGPETEGDIEHILAHEIAHLWNADLYSVPSREQKSSAWLREGAAEAIAFRTLRQLGRLDDATYRERLSTALSLCVLALAEGQPLSASTRPGHSRDFYDCGSTIALFTEGAIQRSATRGDVTIQGELLAFYRQLFTGPDGHYDPARYFSLLEKRNPDAVDFVRRLADERLPNPASDIAGALRGVGLETVAATELPPAYQHQAGAAAVRALVAPACLAALEIRGNYGGEVRVKTDGACGDANRGDFLLSFAGVDYATKGATMFDAAHAACTSKKSIEVERKGKPAVRIPCSDTLRPRPPYLVVRNPSR